MYNKENLIKEKTMKDPKKKAEKQKTIHREAARKLKEKMRDLATKAD